MDRLVTRMYQPQKTACQILDATVIQVDLENGSCRRHKDPPPPGTAIARAEPLYHAQPVIPTRIVEQHPRAGVFPDPVFLIVKIPVRQLALLHRP